MEITRHHVWHNRAWYVSSLDKRFRSYRGFVVPIDRDLHRELHATVAQPPKPTPVLMRGLLDYLGAFAHDYESTLLQTADYLGVLQVVAETEDRREYLQKMVNNLLQQCTLMFDSGYVGAA